MLLPVRFLHSCFCTSGPEQIVFWQACPLRAMLFIQWSQDDVTDKLFVSLPVCRARQLIHQQQDH